MKLWTFSKCKDCGKEFERGVLFESKLDGNIAICPDCVGLASKMLSLDYATLRTRLAAAESALEPFARLADEWGVLTTYLYEDSFINEKITVKDVLAARAALLAQPAAASE